MNAIIERLRNATGPSRELDARIHQALFPDQQVMTSTGDHKGEGVEYSPISSINIDQWKGDFDGIASVFEAKPYTSSIDAALALVERMLPEIGVSIYIDPKKAGGMTTCCFHDDNCDPVNVGDGATPALSILIALFTALAAKEA